MSTYTNEKEVLLKIYNCFAILYSGAKAIGMDNSALMQTLGAHQHTGTCSTLR